MSSMLAVSQCQRNLTIPKEEATAARPMLRLVGLASITVSFLAASSAPTPLYAIYRTSWGFSALTTKASERMGFMAFGRAPSTCLGSAEAQQEFPVSLGALDRGVHRPDEHGAWQPLQGEIPHTR